MAIPRLILAAALALGASACAHQSESADRGTHGTPPVATAATGAALFRTNCAACHGDGGVGARIGPSLVGEHKRKSEGEIRAIIADPDPPMPKLYPAQLTSQDVDDLTAYVETL